MQNRLWKFQNEEVKQKCGRPKKVSQCYYRSIPPRPPIKWKTGYGIAVPISLPEITWCWNNQVDVNVIAVREIRFSKRNEQTRVRQFPSSVLDKNSFPFPSSVSMNWKFECFFWFDGWPSDKVLSLKFWWIRSWKSKYSISIFSYFIGIPGIHCCYCHAFQITRIPFLVDTRVKCHLKNYRVAANKSVYY